MLGWQLRQTEHIRVMVDQVMMTTITFKVMTST